MKGVTITRVAVALLAVLSISGVAFAGRPGDGSLKPQAQGAMTPAQRGQAAKQFVIRWGPYVAKTYGVDIRTWAKRMAPAFGIADAGNIRNALKRTTFEGATADLSGLGHRITDDQAIGRLSKVPATSYDARGQAVAAKFGDLNRDLVYTPVQPCRILDTRNVAAGALANNSTRNFVAFGVSSFASQGGSATNCGVNPLAATAVAINLTAVLPTAAGYATAYPYGSPQPAASSVNYASGAVVNNALIVQTPNPIASFDFTLYTFAQSHYVADIVGYFAPPLATELQCVNTATTDTPVAAGATANSVAPACAAGYTQTATNCQSSTWQMPFVFFSGGTCSAQNNSIGAATLRSSRTCCRVPGR